MTKPEPHPVALLVLGLGLITAACEHTMPPEYHPPEAQPPRSDELPRQLTFTPVGADNFQLAIDRTWTDCRERPGGQDTHGGVLDRGCVTMLT